jgi:hypothetical protein
VREEVGKGGAALAARRRIENDLGNARERVVFDDDDGMVGHEMMLQV